jgi:hypothetical protein
VDRGGAVTAPAGESLFRDLLGAAAFDALPTPIRSLHLRKGSALYRGEVEVQRGRGLLARFCAFATRLPPAGAGPIAVEIVAVGGRERWIRRIGGHAMRSRLHGEGGLLHERLGLVEFAFRLHSAGDDIAWTVQRVRVFGLPLPACWFAAVHARESAQGGRYRFDVAAALPLAGPLVHYRGWLHVE